jgi:hypothetical protein
VLQAQKAKKKQMYLFQRVSIRRSPFSYLKNQKQNYLFKSTISSNIQVYAKFRSAEGWVEFGEKASRAFSRIYLVRRPERSPTLFKLIIQKGGAQAQRGA